MRYHSKYFQVLFESENHSVYVLATPNLIRAHRVCQGRDDYFTLNFDVWRSLQLFFKLEVGGTLQT